MLIREGIEKEEVRQVNPNLTAWYLLGVFSIFEIRIVSSEKLPSNEDIRNVVDLAL